MFSMTNMHTCVRLSSIMASEHNQDLRDHYTQPTMRKTESAPALSTVEKTDDFIITAMVVIALLLLHRLLWIDQS